MSLFYQQLSTWNDLGTWGSLYDKLPKDEQENAVINAKVYLENATNNIIRTEGKKLVVIDGINRLYHCR